MALERLIMKFGIFSLWTIWLSYKGVDDLPYRFWGRKPTRGESLFRIQFVLVKMIASLFGGLIISAFLTVMSMKIFHLHAVSQFSITYVLICAFLVSLAFGALQNLIRYCQGRQLRPILDLALLKYNLRGGSRSNSD
jgi:hypothetical protein